MQRLALLIIAMFCLPVPGWAAQQYTFKVTDQKPQPRENFVQGLEIIDDHLYVSTGLYGRSRLLRYRFADGALDSRRRLDARLFGEGLTVLGDKVYQLTWQNRAMLVYRKSDLQPLQTLPLRGEGWGLTNNGSDLIYSDGSATLRFMDPATAEIRRSITVTDKGKPVTLLNELEWVDGAIWANVWRSDRIVIIDPDSAEIIGDVNLQGLLPPGEVRQSTDVLNGIARNPADGSVWITGKGWPWLYQIELVPLSANSQNQNSGANSVE